MSPAGQVFAGFDYDVTDNLYLGLVELYHLTDTITKNFTHTKAKINPRQLVTLAHVGWRF